MIKHFVRNGGILQRNSYHLRPRQFATFANGIGYFTGLAQANAHPSPLIAYNDQGAKIETAPTFHYFGGAIDEYNLFGQLLLLSLAHRIRRVRRRPVTSRAETPARSAGFGAWRFIPVTWFIWFCHHIVFESYNFRPASRAASASALTFP